MFLRFFSGLCIILISSISFASQVTASFHCAADLNEVFANTFKDRLTRGYESLTESYDSDQAAEVVRSLEISYQIAHSISQNFEYSSIDDFEHKSSYKLIRYRSQFNSNQITGIM
ncbi:MAG: hypothetical protein R2827_00385 [Bdellovibrionales bacterium]